MSYCRLFYHFVWTTKGRRPLINDRNREAIYACIVAKTVQLGGYVHAVNGMEEHVHLVSSMSPTIAVAKYIGQVKGSSSHLAARLPGAEQDVAFGWQTEYAVLTVSEQHLPVVVRYVEEQQTHHRAGRLNLTLERVE